MVENDKKKRYQWPMGRVLEVMPSSDGEVRVVKIKTKNGCIVRSLRRLYPLEMSQVSSKPTTYIERPIYQFKSNQSNEVSSEEENEEIEVKTRSGRKVKKPVRYTSRSK